MSNLGQSVYGDCCTWCSNYYTKVPQHSRFLAIHNILQGPPKGKSPEVLNLVNVVGIQMYLFIISSVLADSHPRKPEGLGGSVGVSRLVGRRPRCFHKVHV